MRSHGTRARYVVDGCRCRPCTRANTDYENRRTKLIAYGRWKPYVPAGPTRAHLDWLLRCGVGLRVVADETGHSRSSLQRVRRGETTKVRPEIQADVMALEPTLDLLRAKTLVDAEPVRRQLAELAAVMPAKKVAVELGKTWPSQLVIRTDQVTAAFARAVRDLHAFAVGEESTRVLSRVRLDLAPLEAAIADRGGVERLLEGREDAETLKQALRRARRRGWVAASVADRWCTDVLGLNPALVWGDVWWRADEETAA